MFKVLSIGFVGLVLLVGCGKGVQQNVPSDATFDTYLEAFDVSSSAYGYSAVKGHISVSFTALTDSSGESGVCHEGTLVSDPSIEIDSYQWAQLGESEREALIYHELGHCLLHQPHRENSVMQARLLSGRTFEENKDTYVLELFSYQE